MDQEDDPSYASGSHDNVNDTHATDTYTDPPSDGNSSAVSTPRKRGPIIRLVRRGLEAQQQSEEARPRRGRKRAVVDEEPENSTAEDSAKESSLRKRPRRGTANGKMEEQGAESLAGEASVDEEAEEESEEESDVDEMGEKIITRDGELLGSRVWKGPVFQVPSKGSRWYMLSIDASKILGFRDSYLFFMHNPTIKRTQATPEDKEYLISSGYIAANLRGRGVAIVPTRKLYKYFGKKMYRKKEKRTERRFVREGEMVAEAGAAEAGMGGGRHNLFGGGTRGVRSEFWIYDTALSAREFNTRLRYMRLEKPRYYDVHTNVEQLPQATQPTSFRVERLPPAGSTKGAAVVEPISVAIEPSAPPLQLSKDQLAELKDVLPPEIHKHVQVNGLIYNSAVEEDDPFRYPIAVLKGQYQSVFPM
ncbi:uncharacterized protein VTP21DRAFT_8358 [Calcarisporiella thermophila]|uniref:uncharacterized protein n=1 Tax=Calcarisporiella thermophila TaxID=911321 RepID=UPI003743E22A